MPEEPGPAGSARGDATAPSDADVTPSDAFQALGDETRLGVLRSLADGDPRTFSDLHADTEDTTSAGFAYHLRQLTDRFVRQRADERYELTSAGRAVVRATRAGTYTDSVDRAAVELDDDCPFCGERALVARVADSVTRVSCTACESPVLSLSFPPSGYDTREADDLAAALDTYHRRRVESFADGVCPDCGGTVATDILPATGRGDTAAPSGDEDGDADRGRVQLRSACDDCGATLRCPVTLSVLDHPAVVSFYHDHGRDVRDRPLWNVGSEWRERVVSRDPWCVLVSARLDGADLLLYVAGDGTVVDHRRVDHRRVDPDDGESGDADGSTAAETDADVDGGVATRDADEGPAERVDGESGATA